MSESHTTRDERGEFIKLDQLLKLSGMVETGGEAKSRIQSGEVRVNGAVETRRGRKLRDGDHVQLGDEEIVLEFEESAPGEAKTTEHAGGGHTP